MLALISGPDTGLRRLAPPARRSLAHARSLVRESPRAWLVVVGVLLPAVPARAAGQFRDARLPAKGELWFDITGSLLNWDSQFAEDSPDREIGNGAREPLFRDFDGPLLDRLFPGISLIDGLNADAGALGFEPIAAGDVSVGGLEFGTINAQRRRLELGFELGFLDRVSLEARVPLAYAEVEPWFAFDSASATLLPAVSAIPSAYITSFRAAVTSLDGLIAGGTLSSGDMAIAVGLRDGATAFADALERRVMEMLYIPTGLSPAGMQMISRVDSLVAGFGLFDVTLPELPLPEMATAEDMRRLFTDPPLSGMVPGPVERGPALGEIELGARIGILDQITHTLALDPPDPRSESPTESGAGEPGQPGAGRPIQPGAGQLAQPVAEPVGLPTDSLAKERRVRAGESPGDTSRTSDVDFIRFRTTIGGKVRLPSGSPNSIPYEDPSDFIGIPIGDGQMDVEIALYQDIAFGRRLLLSTTALYGLQLADELTLRIRPPDRPFAFEGTQALVRRDLGDYIGLRLAPRFQLSGGMWVGLEYGLWHKQVDRYEFGPTLPGVEDATPLEIESEQHRARLGLTFLFEPGLGARRPETPARSRAGGGEAGGEGEARGEEAVRPGRRRTSGWRFAITLQRAVSGSGGQTPASSLVAVTLRAPIRIF